MKVSETLSDNNTATVMIRKAEAKIMFIMTYYILVGTIVLTLFTYLEAIGEVVYQTVELHYTCQSTGVEPDKDCGKSPRDQLSVFRSLSVVSTIVSGLLPLVVLAFTVKCKCRDSKVKG